MMIYPARTPLILYKLYNSSDLWKVNTSRQCIFLTFDDGPVPEITPWVLKQLKAFDAKATFFCVGNNVSLNPDLLDDIIEQGHSVGNHTFDHLNGWKTGTRDYIRNVMKCNYNIPSKLFRPPYGKISPVAHKILRKKYTLVYWTVLSGDFDEDITPEKCLQNAISNTESGSIVVFHDSRKAWRNLKYALPAFLEHFAERGYTFEAIPYKTGNLNTTHHLKTFA